MFNFECLQRKGNLIGTCIDGFLFGVCCEVTPRPTGVNLEAVHEKESMFSMDIINSNKLNSLNNLLTSTTLNVEDTTSKIVLTTKPSESPLITKTKPNTSVLLYTLDAFNRQPVQSSTEDSDGVKITTLYTKLPTTNVLDSTSLSTMLKVHDKLNSEKIKSENPTKQSILDSILEVETSNKFKLSDSKETTVYSETEATTSKPMLIWTLSPQPSIMNSRPSLMTSFTAALNVGFQNVPLKNTGVTAFMTIPKNVLEPTTPMSVNELRDSQSEEEFSINQLNSLLSFSNDIYGGTENSYLTRAETTDSPENTPFTTIQYVDEEPVVATEVDQVDFSDPMAIWTTSKPTRGPALKPRPSIETESTSTKKEELMFWTTSKPSLRPRPTRFPLTTQTANKIEKTRPPSFLTPSHQTSQSSLSTEQLIQDIITNLSGTLVGNDINENEVSNSEQPETTTTEADEAWATSTYSIFPLELDIAQNIIDTDGPVASSVVTSSKKPPTTTKGPANDFSVISPDKSTTIVIGNTTINLETFGRPSVSTEVSPSGTTPIDEFIENLFNSLMYSNTSTGPPLDLDLVQQVRSVLIIYIFI